MDETKKILLKLFCRYPSLAVASETQIGAMTAAYQETLRDFSSQILSAACDAVRGKGGAFPPSADELFVECERAQNRADELYRLNDWKAHGGKRIEFAALPKPVSAEFTYAELADWRALINVSPENRGGYVLRVDRNGDPLRIPAGYPGAGQKVAHGYLTPYEAAIVKEAMARKIPVSHEAIERAKQVIEDHRRRSDDRANSDWLGTAAECEGMLAEAAAGRPSRPVTSISDKLAAQIRGESAIGEGKLGAVPLAWTSAEAAE